MVLLQKFLIVEENMFQLVFLLIFYAVFVNNQVLLQYLVLLSIYQLVQKELNSKKEGRIINFFLEYIILFLMNRLDNIFPRELLHYSLNLRDKRKEFVN